MMTQIKKKLKRIGTTKLHSEGIWPPLNNIMMNEGTKYKKKAKIYFSKEE